MQQQKAANRNQLRSGLLVSAVLASLLLYRHRYWRILGNDRLPMYGHTALRRDILLRHDAKSDGETIELDRYTTLPAHLCPVQIEDDLILGTVISDFISVKFTGLEVRILLKHTEVFRLVTIRHFDAGEGQYRIYTGIFIIAGEEVQRRSCREIKQVQRYSHRKGHPALYSVYGRGFAARS